LQLDCIKKIASALAELDVFCSLAQLAQEERYVRPTLNTEGMLVIRGGKHPVLSKKLQENFVPNDVLLNTSEYQLLVITGPNMAGKSVFMRQVALLVLLAHIGSFVPAESASISVVDRIFVRSGASDNISMGLSTFMVEMVEAAHILHQATSESLVIMDEIGRGTSTYDGISISWAIAEFLVTDKKRKPKVLFATHYHELQSLEEKFPNQIKNYRVAVDDDKGKPVFLFTVERGAASHSFGIAVAKLAGIPNKILDSATEMLEKFESTHEGRMPKNEAKKSDTITQKIESLDINVMTPVAALNALVELQKQVRQNR
jgi:DNA mismatch repair protein MutS